MDISRITSGKNPPKDVHAVIEIPLGGVPVKYEIDKESGALFVDRFRRCAYARLCARMPMTPHCGNSSHALPDVRRMLCSY